MATWQKVVTESSSGVISQKAANVSDADFGDITVSSGSWTIDGLAVTGAKIANTTITSGKIANNAVTNAKIADDAVNSAEIASEAIDTDHIADAQVTTAKIAQNAITDTKIANLAVGTAKLAAGAVTNAKITDGEIGLAKLSATGTADATTYLRGDNTWATVASGYSKWLIGSDDNQSLAATALQIADGEGVDFLGGDGLSSQTSYVSATNKTVITFDVNNTVVRTTGAQTVNGNKTFGDNVTISGNLTVNGTTTTIDTTDLVVQDKLIKIADIADGSVSTTTGSHSGIQVKTATDANSAHWPDIKWTKDQGAHTATTGTANGLTGWIVSNHRTSGYKDHPIAIMDFDSDAPTSSDNSAGVGSFWFDDGELYLRTA